MQVSSKAQLLAALHPDTGLRGLEGLSVSGRNMRLWKLDPTKCLDILQDSECIAAIEAYRSNNPRLVVFAEGLTRESVKDVMALPIVDALCLGEELNSLLQRTNMRGGHDKAISNYTA